MSEENNSGHEHDEHHEHSFPAWVTFGHTENHIEGFLKVFSWLVFWTLLEVGAILQDFSFLVTMFILFGIAAIKCWFICSFFMHMT